MEKTHAQRAVPRDGEFEVSTWGRAKTGIGLAAIGFLILFLLQNFQDATIRFLWFEWTMATTWALLGAAIGGALSAIVISTLRGRRQA